MPGRSKSWCGTARALLMLNIILGWLLIGLNESFIILKFLLVKFCVLISHYSSGKWKWRVPAQQQAAGCLTTSCNNTRLLLGSVTTEETCELILYNKKNLSELSLFSINLPLDMYNYFYKKKILFLLSMSMPLLSPVKSSLLYKMQVGLFLLTIKVGLLEDTSEVRF